MGRALPWDRSPGVEELYERTTQPDLTLNVKSANCFDDDCGATIRFRMRFEKKIAPRRRSWFGGRGTGGRKKIESRLEIAPEPTGGDIRAGHDGKLGGSPIWRCPEPTLHVALAGGPGALTAAGSGEEVVPVSITEPCRARCAGCSARRH